MAADDLPWGTWEGMARVQEALTGTMAAATMVAPRALLRLFGVEPTPGTVLFFRAFGASLAFVAVAHRGLRTSRDPGAVRTILLANVAEDALLTLLSLGGVARGTLGKAGWLLVGVFGAEVVVNAWLAAQFAGASAPTATEVA